tara:strand:+ start:100 stop:594 length:495 start_codon:yes stop_codon:yes gene_type:complete
MNLSQICQKDQLNLKKVYFDSINSIDENLYSKDQKFAWASQAWENPEFDKSILEGKGWKLSINKNIIGFATRYPENRLSLFYIKGNLKRKGYGSLILDTIEEEALKDGIRKLEVEASLISYRLLLKRNWEIIRKEEVLIKGIIFKRYRMLKILKNKNKKAYQFE